MKLEIEKIGNRFAIVRRFSSAKDQNKYLKEGDQLINTNTGFIRKVENFQGSLGYTSDNGVAFLYFQYHHVQLVKYITQTDLQQLCKKKLKKSSSLNH